MAEGSVLTGSVGAFGSNRQNDVERVQTLLNGVPQSKGGPMPALDKDGICGPKTITAIARFQSVAVGFQDGRIDPGGKSEQALVAILRALGLLLKLLGHKVQPPKQEKPVPPKPVSPPAKGDATPIRQRFMEICRNLLPPQGHLTNGTGPKGHTSCGEFPSRVFLRVPTLRSWQPGAFRVRIKTGQTLFLDSFQTAWEAFADAVDKDYAPAKTWVKYNGTRPRPGDIYVLHNVDNPEKFQHVGVIVDANGTEWLTADGGQGNGHQSGFMKRTFSADGEITGEFGNRARLRGWVDLDELWAVIVKETPNKLLTS